jgi:hypothetical protein
MSMYGHSKYNVRAGDCCANCHWIEDDYCHNLKSGVQHNQICDLFSITYDESKDREEILKKKREEKKNKEM